MTAVGERRAVTVVTGASRGIGAAICRRLAEEGHDVVVGYRGDEEAAQKVAADVRLAGRESRCVQVETADADSVERFFDEAASALGPLTGLVNNAGIGGPNGELAEADPAGLRRALEVNVLGYLLCARRAIREFDRREGHDGGAGAGGGPRGGAIVNISSAAATLGSPGLYVHYAAAKAAVDAMTVGLSKELAPRGIRVNCVAPGTVWTEFHQDPQRPALVAPNIPLGRAARPEEIAGAVAWLLSPDASYTTGAILRVAGGL